MKHQKLARLFALTLPLLGAIASAHAQDYSYNDDGNGGVSNNGGVYGNRNGGYNNGGYNNGGYNNGTNANSTRLRGTVERVYSSRSFDLRTQNGQIVRVKSDSDLNLQVGDTTTVRGELRGKTFYAERINRRDDNLPGNQGRETRVELRGQVIAVEGRRALRVRDNDDGRILRVQTQGNLNSRISRGDLVVVRGTFDGSFLRADARQVQLVSYNNRTNGNNGDGYGYGNNGNVYGNNGNGYGYGNGNGNVYGNNGNGYGYGNGNGNGNVYGNNGNGYGYGNNGNVYGNGNNGYGNGNNGYGYGNIPDDYGTGNDVFGRNVSFPGTVRVVSLSQVEVRGDNGRIYIVRFLNNERVTVRTGDRVRVQGISRNGFIEATQLNRTY
jgi:translation initiation factor IF-1